MAKEKVETEVSGELRVRTYLFFKELSPQLGVHGRQHPPQIPVPLPNHVSPPASLDPMTRVGEKGQVAPVRGGRKETPPPTVTPAIGGTSEHLLPLRGPGGGGLLTGSHTWL